MAVATLSPPTHVALWAWEFNKVYTLPVASGQEEIDYDGREKLFQIFCDHNLPRPPDDWDWRANVPKGEYSGSFVKRYRKWLHKERTQWLSNFNNDVAGQIGSVIGQHVGREYHFKFDNQFTWNAGRYGDGGSCYFTSGGCRSFMPKNLRENGANAILFVKPCGKGIGRALIIPHPSEKEQAVIINAYGLTILQSVRILSQFCGLSYRQVIAENYGQWDGDFYINNGAGFVIAENVEDYSEDGDTEIDFKWDIENCHKCCRCECSVDEEDEIVIDDEIYCRDCVSFCEDCEEYTTEETTNVYDSRGRERYVCEACAENNYRSCPCCDRLIPSN